jgi:H+-transporting ATPase
MIAGIVIGVIAVALVAGTVMARRGGGLGLVTAISWPLIGFTWAYAIAWVSVEDWAKLAVYRHLSHTAPHHQRFPRRLQQHLQPGP